MIKCIATYRAHIQPGAAWEQSLASGSGDSVEISLRVQRIAVGGLHAWLDIEPVTEAAEDLVNELFRNVAVDHRTGMLSVKGEGGESSSFALDVRRHPGAWKRSILTLRVHSFIKVPPHKLHVAIPALGIDKAVPLPPEEAIPEEQQIGPGVWSSGLISGSRTSTLHLSLYDLQPTEADVPALRATSDSPSFIGASTQNAPRGLSAWLTFVGVPAEVQIELTVQ